MTGITIFYGDNIIRYVVNTKKGLRPYFKQLPDNYQAKFELNLMSKFSNFII
ncbi:transcriptional regulator, partial [Shigella flexneri]